MNDSLTEQQLAAVKIIYELAIARIKSVYEHEAAQEEFEAINEIVKQAFPNNYQNICFIKLEYVYTK